MKRLSDFAAGWLCGCLFLLCISATAANLPSDWQHEQRFNVADWPPQVIPHLMRQFPVVSVCLFRQGSGVRRA